MYAQCDADGNKFLLLDSLVDYHKDNEAKSLTEQQISIQGRPVTSKSTAGWQIYCQWKDGSTSWGKLSHLKESHPLQMAEFAIVQGILMSLLLTDGLRCTQKKRQNNCQHQKTANLIFHNKP